MENRVNCWNSLRAACTTAMPVTASAMVRKATDWEISSQATARAVEGSTTRPRRLGNETVKAHECAAVLNSMGDIV